MNPAEPAINREVASSVSARGIGRICHFTRFAALDGIAAWRAVLSNALLRGVRTEFEQNDPVRYDGHEDYVSCTVQYPNVFLLTKWMEERGDDWVVLCMDPEPIAYSNSLFCPTNAATNSGALLEPGPEGFQRMFRNDPSQEFGDRSPAHLRNAPTDNQAELLVRSGVKADLIRSLVVRDSAAGERLRDSFDIGTLPVPVKLVACRAFFDRDLAYQVQWGRRPDTFHQVLAAPTAEEG
ncbi:MAG: DarT ssDNA thymidine ADP-ribosyltransferase family protein [Acidimicrobiales bacterium]|nr:DarT ssDNA thymidine ADP-ribosyltransferase family protein [Acidimicrobiales bacterium]